MPPKSGTFEQRLAVADTYWFVGTDVFQQARTEMDRLELGNRVASQLDAGAFLVQAGTDAQVRTGIEYARAEGNGVIDWLLEK